MAKKLTPLQSAYQKEYRRLRKGFGRYTKEGYEFPEQVIPKNPKRVTQQMLQSLKEIKPRQLKPVATKVDIDTGEIVQEEKKKSLKKISTTKVAPAKLKKAPKPKPIELPKPQTKTPEEELLESVDWYSDVDTSWQTEDTSYYPTMDIIDSIRDAIADLPDYNEKGIPLHGRRNYLLDLLDDTINSIPDDELYLYDAFLKEHQHEIFSGLERNKHDSNDERVTNTFTKVGELLNYGLTLLPEQSEHLSLMQEMM